MQRIKRVLPFCVSLVVFCVFVLRASPQQLSVADEYYQAIRNNDLAALKRFTAEYGANVKDNTGLTPVILATAFGTKEAVELLVVAGADVKSASNSGVTALHTAWHDERVVRLLLDHGAM